MKHMTDIIRKLQTRWIKVPRRKFEENGQMRSKCIKKWSTPDCQMVVFMTVIVIIIIFCCYELQHTELVVMAPNG